jgi:succinate dehydrogenase / fumarate reductase iron-sulfur subunit
MNLTLHVWRQKGAQEPGKMVTYQAPDVSPDMSFLEMLDVVNEGLMHKGDSPIAFDHDCREGICGSCSMTVNGIPHGPERGTTVCQLHMRHFKDGDSITIEPWRSRAFPVKRDLIVDRSAFDRITQAGGYISINTGGAPDANALPIFKGDADEAFDAAACIACGACVAGCKNGSAMLYVSAKVSHFSMLPQGKPEQGTRVRKMLAAMDKEGFGACSNQYECEAVCPKSISVRHIARTNREFLKAILVE